MGKMATSEIRFLADDLWPTLRKISSKAKVKHMAVSYFGEGAVSQLSLSKNDTLVIAMSTGNVKAGIIHPGEVEKAFNKGVKIYKYENLHSKVYVFDEQAIICSANASQRSEKTLQEAGLFTNDPKTVKQAELFVKKLCIELVDEQYIRLCKKIYIPPRVPSLGMVNGKKKNENSAFSNLWIISTFPKSLSVEDEMVLEKTKPEFIKKIKNDTHYSIENVEYKSNARILKDVQYGDRVIELYKTGSVVKVYSDMRILGVTTNRKTGKAFIRIESKNNQVAKSWTSFEKHLHKHGIRYIKKTSTRNLKSAEAKRALLAFIKLVQ